MRKWSSVLVAVLLLIIADAADFDFDFEEMKEKAKQVMKDCRIVLNQPCPDLNGYVKFHLYTRQNNEASQIVQVSKERDNFHKTHFNSTHPNKIIIHGFSPMNYKDELLSVKDAYLEREETNVWMVDWSKLANGGTCIMFSLRNTNHVARCTAQLVRAIERHAPDSSVHVIADRSGVRVAHRLAHEIKPLLMDRITGLNPEGGIIPTGNDVNRLSSWDAAFVDAIHSLPFLPNSEMYGHIDFFVNPSMKTVHQPGCDDGDRFVCDQRRAIEYFAESITTKVGFYSWECSSYTLFSLGTCNPHSPSKLMGDLCPTKSSGTYIVHTANESPYALGRWKGKRYREKGPKNRDDFVSKYASNVQRNLQLLEGKTPQILKEAGFMEILKSKLEHETVELKSVAIDFGLKGIKSLASHYLGKQGNETEGILKAITHKYVDNNSEENKS